MYSVLMWPVLAERIGIHERRATVCAIRGQPPVWDTANNRAAVSWLQTSKYGQNVLLKMTGRSFSSLRTLLAVSLDSLYSN